MSPIENGAHIVEQAMAHLLPCKFDSTAARVMLLAIGMQESGFIARQQKGGPARSFWQFEQAGGIQGVLTHPASKAYARAFCGLRAVAPVASDVYAAFLSDDQLACAFARLLLWTDAAPLPQVGDAAGAWAYYLRNWRPGKPRPEAWAANYAAATHQVGQSWRVSA
jgi:hypothetical protein